MRPEPIRRRVRVRWSDLEIQIDLNATTSVTDAAGGLCTRRSLRCGAAAAGCAVADTPHMAIESIGMTNFAMQLVLAGIGLDEQPIRQTCLPEHPVVWGTAAVGSDVTAGCARIYPVRVQPPGGGALFPVFRF